MPSRHSRTAALLCLVLAGIAVVYAVGVALTGWDASWVYVLRAVIHLGELAGVVALALSGAAGPGLLGRIGLGVAAVGQVLLTVAELAFPGSPGLADTLFSVGPVLSGLGMVLAGVAVLRAGMWTGWQRFVPLAIGVWVFVVMTPALIASGGPPAPAAVLAIAGWDVGWVLLALAVLSGAGARRPEHVR